MKVIRFLLLVIIPLAALAMIQSCDRTPTACFNISVNADSIHVNEPVIFNATCSYLAKEYFWQFQEANDSIVGSYNPVVTETFDDTGNVLITLTVFNGNQSTYVTQTVDIRP